MYPLSKNRALYALVGALNVLLASATGLSAATFENTAVVRTVDLGGALTQVTTTYAVRALEDNAKLYYISLSDDEEKHTTWIEVKLKGQSTVLDVERHGFNPKNHAYLYAISLPKALKHDQTANIVVSTVQSHASTALPATAAQGEPQSLLFSSPLYIISPYKSTVQRTKIRSPTPMIRSYTDTKDLSQYVEKGAAPVTKTGPTLVYGPFHNIPESMNLPFQERNQKTVSIHYDYDQPVLTVASLQRSAEISHWGANLNIHDEIVLRNDGPTLKGQFSRLEHQTQVHFKRKAAHVMKDLVLHLPAGARDPYFIDLVGNVSTSHFRPSPPTSTALLSTSKAKSSILELKPRYPLLGGWNYTFTLGYDSPLEEVARYDSSTGKYVVAIPYMTNIPGAAFDETELKIVLPEGATDVTVHPSFGPDVIERSRHVTYLDTTGRPAILLKKKNVSDKHAGTVYVSYNLSLASHFKKPIAVTSAALALFTFALGILRSVSEAQITCVSNFRPPRSELGQHQVSYEPRERRGNSDLSGPSREGRPSNLSPPTRQDHTFRSTKRASERPPTAKSGPPREVHVAHTVKELCKEGKLDEAVEYCENTPVALQGPVAWNTVITYALQEKRYNFAYQQFLAMKKRAVVPTVPTYNLFLSAYAEADPKVLTPLQRERAQKIYSDWTSLVLSAKAGTSKGVDRSHPAAAYIDALANMGDFQAIWDVFYQLGSEGPLAPNEHVFTSMFLAIAKRNVQDEEGLAKIRARNAEDGKLIWRQVLRAVEKQPFPIDSHLVTSALRVLRHGGPAEHELAFTIIKDYLGLQAPDPSALVDISEPDVPLDTRAVDAALSVCMSADRHDLVHHFLNTLIHSKDPHRSRAVTTSAMKYALISYAAAGNTRQALETIDWMLRESGVRDGLDVKPGNSSWASAFRACIQTKDWSTAKALMQRLFGHDLRHWVTIPDAETMYLILHSAYVSKPSDRRSHELQIRETLSMIELVIRRWAPAPARLAEVQPARVKRRLDFHKKLADLVKQVLLEFEGLKNSSRWNALGRRLGEMQASLSNDPVAPNKGRS